jgi:8-oxo-dGTP pyrophosphatase MutT (NUDIX family)
VEPHAINAAGILFYAADTKKRLFLFRSTVKHKGTWGLVGGKLEVGETLLEGLLRETQEEIGFVPEISKIIPVEKFTSADDRFSYHTFLCVTPKEFLPHLNHEHSGYCWLAVGEWPRPLHPGLWSTISAAEVKTKITQVESALNQYHTQK